MILLLLGLALWWAVHMMPVFFADRRAGLVASVGALPYKGGAAVLLILSVVLMAQGYQGSGSTILWVAPGFLWHLNNLLMVLAVFVFIAGSFRSIVRQKIRHPQLTGLKIWALAHLLVNGDLHSVLLFGGLLAWAVVTLIGTNKRDGARAEVPAATTQGLIVHVAVALGVFVVVLLVHNWLGVRPFPG